MGNSTLRLEDLVERLPANKHRSGTGWRSSCPAHNGTKADSLSVAPGNSRAIVTQCFSHGCSYEDILKSVGLWSEDFSSIITTQAEFPFDYVDRNGNLLYQVLRLEPVGRVAKGEKDFLQRRPDGKGGWVWHLDCVDEPTCRKMNHKPLLPAHTQRVPYRIQDLLKAREAKESPVVYKVEGERKCERLAALGTIATTFAGGHGSWREEYAHYFDGLTVVILPDNDEKGGNFAAAVSASLSGRTMWLTTLRLPSLKEKQDVDDWITAGGTLEELTRLTDNALFAEIEHYNPVQRTRGPEDWADDPNIKRLRGFLRDDLLVRTEVSMIFGPAGCGKSYLAWHVGQQVVLKRSVYDMVTRPGRVLFLSEEMPPPVIKERCRRMWTQDERRELQEHGWRCRCQSEFDFVAAPEESRAKLERIIREEKADLVFLDALADLHSGNENSNEVMGSVLKLIRAVARACNCAIVVIHHAGKSSELREGADLARGASVMRDKCADMIHVKKVAGTEPRSVVVFEKTRHVVGTQPASFDYAQEEDLERQVDVSDREDAEPIFKSGVRILTTEHVEVSVTGRDVRRLVDAVDTLAQESGAADYVLKATFLEWAPNRLGWPKKRTAAVFREAVGLGMLRASGRPCRVSRSEV